MASLADINNNLLVKLILYPDKDSQDWITYEIIIFSGDEKRILLKLSQEGLYLEACFEPEIIAIYDEMLDVLYGEKTNFEFEPIDQKEFKLEINSIDKNLFSIEIYSMFFKIFGIHEWDNYSQLGVKFLSDREALLSFIRQLKNEYEKIKPERKLLSKNSIK